jgi:hypothetical protein
MVDQEQYLDDNQLLIDFVSLSLPENDKNENIEQK